MWQLRLDDSSDCGFCSPVYQPTKPSSADSPGSSLQSESAHVPMGTHIYSQSPNMAQQRHLDALEHGELSVIVLQFSCTAII